MIDLLFRIRRKVSFVAFNNALPVNFKLLDADNNALPGVNIDQIPNLILKEAVVDSDGNITTPAVLSSDLHVNIRLNSPYPVEKLLITDPEDPDFNDPKINKSKIKQWMKNNGLEKTDAASAHTRSNRSDMRWFRWTDGTEWVEITIDEPSQRRRVWL